MPVPEALKLTETEKVASKMLSMGSFTDEQISAATGVRLEKLRYLTEVGYFLNIINNYHFFIF